MEKQLRIAAYSYVYMMVWDASTPSHSIELPDKKFQLELAAKDTADDKPAIRDRFRP